MGLLMDPQKEGDEKRHQPRYPHHPNYPAAYLPIDPMALSAGGRSAAEWGVLKCELLNDRDGHELLEFRAQGF